MESKMNHEDLVKDKKENSFSYKNALKFFGFSFIGIFMFFVPIPINGNNTIPLDHLVNWIKGSSGVAINSYVLVLVIIGAIYPFYNKSWNRSAIDIGVTVFKILGSIATILVIFGSGPAWLMSEDMGPYWLNTLLIPIGLLLPIGAIALAMLAGYGLLEFIGVFMQVIMRPVFKTPGRSAIDAVASFVGSYSLSLLITNKLYKEGKYTVREATIIATGFSTVSATFMIVVANALDLMHIWNLYFWLTLLVTFIVTAITVRIWPVASISDTYYDEKGDVEVIIKNDRFKHAWDAAMEQVVNTPNFVVNIYRNLIEGFKMATALLPIVMSVGLLGFILVYDTVIYDYIAYIFYPLTLLLKIPEPFLAAKALSISLIDMFVPALIVVEAPLHTRFIIASVSISAIVFFSGLIPSVLATDIPVKLKDFIMIWFIRVVLSLIIITPITYLIL